MYICVCACVPMYSLLFVKNGLLHYYSKLPVYNADQEILDKAF